MNNRGFSETILVHMHKIMAGCITRGEVPGIVTLVNRRST